MILYIYSKCSTCKAALDFLEKRTIKAEVREITTHPPTMKELERMLQFQGNQVQKLLNTSGQLYREMDLTKRRASMPQAELFKLLTQHGMLIKRPFLLAKDFGLTGFKEAEWAQKFVP